ncbi:hypothetical protein DL98DRAFT_429350 [Cadophora sp. DSE1049]|nr:hypothetical protein DL98DRAFT_429350 [Cadophora sp. DSE1049]
MKGPAVDQLVYEFMFPKPKPNDPQNFQGLLQRNLVPEVRLETQAFYGHLSSQEAKYPGLDYSYQPHRVRLSRYPWHRRLFRAFDNVGLTKHEIASLTKWEGTRWAKERFEREQGIVIRDTTADGISDWVPPQLRVPVAPLAHRADIEDMEDIQEDEETEDNEPENEMDEDIDDSDVEIQSVGVALNEQLRANAALREAGSDTVMDEAWEQWLKEAAESGGIPYMPAELSPNANIPGTRPAPGNSQVHATPPPGHITPCHVTSTSISQQYIQAALYRSVVRLHSISEKLLNTSVYVHLPVQKYPYRSQSNRPTIRLIIDPRARF